MPKFYCIHCGQHIDAPDEMAGTNANCPTCNGEIQVPRSTKKPPPLPKVADLKASDRPYLEGDKRTMTYSEAEMIIDLISSALQSSHPSGYVPLSLLRGYDLIEIICALKLQIANAYLSLCNHPNFEKIYNDTIRSHSATPWHIMNSVVADKDINDVMPPLAMSAINPETMEMDERFGSIENVSSFADFCKKLGASHPHYWANVYTRIGLDYTNSSPYGNEPQAI